MYYKLKKFKYMITIKKTQAQYAQKDTLFQKFSSIDFNIKYFLK